MKRNPALVALAIPALGAALALTMPAPKSTVPTTATGNLGVPDNLRSIVRRACRDCHSNETQWPWYSQIPTVSLLLQHHVSKGREHLNFSAWDGTSARKPTPNQMQEVCDVVSDKTMPPWSYRLMHPEARLSASDIDTFCTWTDKAYP